MPPRSYLFKLPEPYVTADMIMAQKPCSAYPRERVETLFPGTGLTVPEICDLPIPLKDRVWVLLHPEVIGERLCHEAACDFAAAALELAGNPDPRSVNAIAVKRRWIVGTATSRELNAAAKAAKAAANATANATTAWAAWAAREAARAAAWEAAAAARVAPWENQIEWCRQRCG